MRNHMNQTLKKKIAMRMRSSRGVLVGLLLLMVSKISCQLWKVNKIKEKAHLLLPRESMIKMRKISKLLTNRLLLREDSHAMLII